MGDGAIWGEDAPLMAGNPRPFVDTDEEGTALMKDELDDEGGERMDTR